MVPEHVPFEQTHGASQEVLDAPGPTPVGNDHLPPHIRAQMQERMDRIAERVHPWSPAVRRRMAWYALGFALFVPILVRLVSGMHWGNLVYGIPIGAFLGAFLGQRRSHGSEAGFAMLAAGLLCLVIPGRLQFGMSAIFVGAVFYVVGRLIGLHHEMRAWDGQ